MDVALTENHVVKHKMALQKSVLLLPQPSNSINLLNEFKQFRQGKRFLDISLICDKGVRVDCHSMVLATSNSFWRGVLKSLEGLGFHGIDEGSRVEILMPELTGQDVEKFVDTLYEGERFVNGKTNPNKIFLLEDSDDDDQLLNIPHRDGKDHIEDSSLIGQSKYFQNMPAIFIL